MLWVRWSLRVFFEAFLWLGWMTSNTCFENFPSQIISVVPYVMKHWGPSKTFFHVLELTPSCWRRAAVWFWLVLLQGLLQPIPSWWWWGVVSTSRFHNRCLRVPFLSLISLMENKLGNPLEGIISNFLQSSLILTNSFSLYFRVKSWSLFSVNRYPGLREIVPSL